VRRIVFGIGYLALATALVFAAGASPADAFSCSAAGGIYSCTNVHEGDTLTYGINQTIGPDHLVANVSINVFDINNGHVLLDLDLTNSSSPGSPSSTANRITVFGLGIDPNVNAMNSGSVSDLSITDTDALTSFDTSNFPDFPMVEFCAASGNNCAGGGSGGLRSGEEDLFRFTLNGNYADGGSITLNQFVFRFQGGQTSYELPGSPGGRVPPTQVPAEASLALVATGLATLTARRLLRGRSN